MRRRALLHALGAGAAALPWVPVLPSGAEVDASPRRLLIVHFAHGVAADRWRSQGDATTLAPGPTLLPLAPYLDRVVVVDGLVNEVGRRHLGDVHNAAVGTLLTAVPLAADHGPGGHYLPGGISIDRRIGLELAAAAGSGAPPHATLHFGVRTQGFAISAAAAEQPLRAEDDPAAQYRRVFGELALPPADRQVLNAARAQTRAFVRARLSALSSELPRQDRDAIARHAEAVDAIEARAVSDRPLPAACELPTPALEIDDAATPADLDVPALVDETSALVVAALSCDLTRAATLQWGSSGNDGLRHAWQGITDDYHSIAHLANGADPAAHETFAAMNGWYVERLADLLARMDAVDEGDGTLLDHTVVVLLSSVSIVHDMTDLPVVLVGGGLSGARRVVARDASLTGLWLALARHVGAPLSGFGDPEHDEGELPGIAS